MYVYWKLITFNVPMVTDLCRRLTVDEIHRQRQQHYQSIAVLHDVFDVVSGNVTWPRTCPHRINLDLDVLSTAITDVRSRLLLHRPASAPTVAANSTSVRSGMLKAIDG